MKRLFSFFIIIIASIAAFAGKPYFGGETGLAFNRNSEVMWTVGGVAGYSMPTSSVATFAPEVMLGAALVHSDLFMLGGPTEYGNSANFVGSLRANLTFRLHKQLGFYTAPNLNFIAGGCDEILRHWGFSWLVGLKYNWDKFTFRISYNQQITRNFHYRLNPISLGVEYYF